MDTAPPTSFAGFEPDRGNFLIFDLLNELMLNELMLNKHTFPNLGSHSMPEPQQGTQQEGFAVMAADPFL